MHNIGFGKADSRCCCKRGHSLFLCHTYMTCIQSCCIWELFIVIAQYFLSFNYQAAANNWSVVCCILDDGGNVVYLVSVPVLASMKTLHPHCENTMRLSARYNGQSHIQCSHTILLSWSRYIIQLNDANIFDFVFIIRNAWMVLKLEAYR